MQDPTDLPPVSDEMQSAADALGDAFRDLVAVGIDRDFNAMIPNADMTSAWFLEVTQRPIVSGVTMSDEDVAEWQASPSGRISAVIDALIEREMKDEAAELESAIDDLEAGLRSA